MNIEVSLLNVFEKTLRGHYSGLPLSDMGGLLRQNLEKKKFDTQDEGIIEAILSSEDNPLDESFIENLESYISRVEGEADRAGFLRTKEGQEKAVEIFVSTLEQLINYFYNTLLNKHLFSA